MMNVIDTLKYILDRAESKLPEDHILVSVNVPVEIVQEIISTQQWAPCSERMPEQGVDVLVTWTNGVDIAHWDIGPDGRYWDFGEFWLKEWEGDIHDVIAWMPLPEPYTEEQS